MSDELPKALKAYLIAHLRRIGYRNVYRAEAFKRAHLGRAQWQCEGCREIFKSSKDLHGDHIDPVVNPETGFVSWDEYIHKLFLGKIQALCIGCHKQKSGSENERRREKRVENSGWDNID